MDIDVKILDAEESWQHQINIYNDYHQKYSHLYQPTNFFYHPYLLEKFSNPDLNKEELHHLEVYFKNNIYDIEYLEQAKDLVSTGVIPFILSKNVILQQLPIRHPALLTISLSGAMSGGFYDVEHNKITLSPKCVTENFLPLLATHEFTHICVQDSVQKYQLSHIAKERLVSRICSELLGFDDHNAIKNDQLDKFITKDKLIADYNAVLSCLQ